MLFRSCRLIEKKEPRALVHRPRLLLLDEPTSGLDVSAIDRLGRVVREEAADGVTVIVVTHDPRFSEVVGGLVTTLERGQVQASLSSVP